MISKIINYRLIIFVVGIECFSSMQRYTYGQTNEMQHSTLNFLTNTTWETDLILGLDPEVEIYKLKKYRTPGKFAGNIISFTDSINFVSEYTSWCGNDYFTKVAGQYRFVGKDKIEIVVSTVSYS